MRSAAKIVLPLVGAAAGFSVFMLPSLRLRYPRAEDFSAHSLRGLLIGVPLGLLIGWMFSRSWAVSTERAHRSLGSFILIALVLGLAAVFFQGLGSGSMPNGLERVAMFVLAFMAVFAAVSQIPQTGPAKAVLLVIGIGAIIAGGLGMLVGLGNSETLVIAFFGFLIALAGALLTLAGIFMRTS